MQINDHPNFAVRGTNVSNFNLEYSTVNGSNGSNAASDEGSVAFDELTGSASVVSSIVQGAIEDTFRVVNTAGTLDRITFDNFTLGPMNAATGDNGVFIQATNSAVIKATVQNSNLTSARGDMLQFDLVNTATGELIFKDNVVNNVHPNVVTGGGGITLSNGGSATAAPALTYDIEGSSFRGARGSALLILMQIGSGSATGRIENNTFGVSGVDRSGSREASTIDVRTSGRGAHTVLVDGNTIRQYSNHGILLQIGDQNISGSVGLIGGLNATVINNTIEQPSSAVFNKNGFQVNLGTSAGDTHQACVDVRNNTGLNGGSTDAGAGTDYLLRQRMLTTMRLPGYAGANNNNAAVVLFIQNQNIGSESVLAQNSVSTGGGGFVGGAACSQPADLALFDAPEANNNFTELAANAGDVNTDADARQTAQGGFAADREFNSASKIRRGFANSERGQLLGDGMGESVETLKTVRAAAPATATLAGETVTIPIGTLRAGDSVTITFQVTVADPFTGSPAQVSNQGTVTADGGVSVLTDDPTEPGGADPTVTPILLPPTININDGTVAEPASGSANATFTVTLSHPFTSAVTVDYTTASGGANPATAGADYTTTSGTLTFAAGETVQTVSVPALADLSAGEADETFLVNLSDAVNGVIADGTATGTITDGSVASPVIISELRTSGPNGSGDDFVELLNTTDSDITVVSSDGSTGWSIVQSGAGCSTTPVVVGVVPNGTVIRARGNYLLTGSAYSLGAYAAGDTALSADIENDRNVGLFTTANLANISSVTRLDAVGFGANTGNNCDLLREGNNLSAASGSSSQYSFVRKVTLGLTHDTGDNATDFVVVSTTPSIAVGDNSTPTLGAPGPEGSGSPTGPVPCAAPAGSDLFGRTLIDPSVSNANAPNVVRDATSGPNSTFGTLDFRRTFTNNTGASVTSLRFRVVNLSTLPVAAAGAADLRALTSATMVVSTAGGPVTVQGTTLETPPAQASGGGVNSSLAAGTISLATPLAAGASVNLRFLFGVEQVGDYSIAFVLEALPGPSGKDIWKLSGHTETGGHTDGGCNEPPVANAGPDQTVECSNGQASVTLDGSLSSDPDGDTPLTFQWSEGATSLGTGQTLGVTLSNGSHTITLTVTDPSGESSQDTVVVNVVDTTDPVVTPPANVTVTTGPGECAARSSRRRAGTATADDG